MDHGPAKHPATERERSAGRPRRIEGGDVELTPARRISSARLREHDAKTASLMTTIARNSHTMSSRCSRWIDGAQPLASGDHPAGPSTHRTRVDRTRSRAASRRPPGSPVRAAASRHPPPETTCAAVRWCRSRRWPAACHSLRSHRAGSRMGHPGGTAGSSQPTRHCAFLHSKPPREVRNVAADSALRGASFDRERTPPPGGPCETRHTLADLLRSLRLPP